ncbi:MAG: CinA family nicotinamide mononucleotide deamidase-related protein [Crocinitomicaceae bacterium]|nr:CinA family nicotinamide mononucleotide deamidase-related protein [Crocinitomicaceae bacterium]
MIKASIITIGDEILVGQTIDTNSAWIAQQLYTAGISIQEIISISDKADVIKESLDRELNKSDLVFITGGLGPTQDDITKSTLTEYFKQELILYPGILEKVKHMFASANKPFLEVNRLQAMLPDKARIIENDLGTASGMWFKQDGKSVISLPGVPYEMKGLMEKIIPALITEYGIQEFYHKTILFQGIGESQLSMEIAGDEKKCREQQISVAYLPSPGIVKIRLTGSKNQIPIIQNQISEWQKKFPQLCFGTENDTLEIVIGQLLRAAGKTLSTVESCTGGALSARIVSVAGSSDYYQGSVISYANAVKEKIAGVNPDTLRKFGAVSQQTVEEMASNGKRVLGTDYCISTSGIAGPDGGTPEKPVGTVWIAIATPDHVYSKNFLFKHNRERNIELTVVYALNFFRRVFLKID